MDTARAAPVTLAIVEPLGGDVLALAQCAALDATAFPHPSLPPRLDGARTGVWVARAEAGGPVVGFATVRRRGAALEIAGLAVDPGHRRAGLGRALLREAVDEARERGALAVTLHVSTGNAAALALYRAEGFAVLRLQPRFYRADRFPDGGDAYEMALLLD